MAIQRPDTSGIEQAWLNGIPHDPNETRWCVYDSVILATKQVFDAHLKGQLSYAGVDWLLIKAMCWTETGAGSKQWFSRPMQIGNPSDAGLPDLLRLEPKNMTVLPPEWYKGGAQALTFVNVRTDPTCNIRAGIGYLLFKACDLVTNWVATGPETTTVLKRRDSFATVAARMHTTMRELESDNPGLTTKPPRRPPHEGDPKQIMPGMTVRFRPQAPTYSLNFVRAIDSGFAARVYNGNDVERYRKKIDYCLWVLNGGALGGDKGKSDTGK